MHRLDAATVSWTEVAVSSRQRQCRGDPGRSNAGVWRRLHEARPTHRRHCLSADGGSTISRSGIWACSPRD